MLFLRRALSNTITSYTRYNDRHPVATQAISAGVVAAVGDLLMQKIENRGYDFARTGRMIIYRTFFFAPCYTIFLRILERTVKLPPARAVMGKIVLEQMFWAAPSLTMFYTVMNMLEGKSFQEGIDRCRDLMATTMKVNWAFWIPVQAITFGIIPYQFRVLWVSIVQVGWNAWLSGFNNDYAIGAKPNESKNSQWVEELQ